MLYIYIYIYIILYIYIYISYICIYIHNILIIFNWKFEFKEIAYLINNQSVIKKNIYRVGVFPQINMLKLMDCFLKTELIVIKPWTISQGGSLFILILPKFWVSFFVSSVSFDELLGKYKMSKCSYR